MIDSDPEHRTLKYKSKYKRNNIVYSVVLTMHLLWNVLSVSDAMILFTLTFFVLHYTIFIFFMMFWCHEQYNIFKIVYLKTKKIK